MTAVTKDKSLSAQFEHTVGVTKNGCEIFTLSKKTINKMIDRYSRKEIKDLGRLYKYSIWLDIELAAAEAMENLISYLKEL